MDGDATPGPATFDPALLQGVGHAGIDLSRFERGTPVSAGVLDLDVYRNGHPLGRRFVRFELIGRAADAVPCIDASLAQAAGIAAERLPFELRRALSDATHCAQLAQVVPGARAVHDSGELALHLSIPHAALAHRPGDEIDPALRDAGMPALRVNYGVMALHHAPREDGRAWWQGSASLDLGANAGSWRFRHRAIHHWHSLDGWRHQPIATTLARDVDAVQAQLVFGQFHTDGVLFDSVGLRGVRLASDDRMQPASQLRYAPVVRGIADTPARVTVRQGDVLLHDTTVAAGAFAITDILPVARGGALEVRVTEADGRTRTWSVPHAAMPGLLRRGRARFAVAGGVWDADASNNALPVYEATLQHGTFDRATTHAGVQVAPDYAQVLGGAVLATGLGAFALDASHSRLDLVRSAISGNSVRLRYAGHLPATETTIDIAAWRFDVAGFHAFDDAMRRRIRPDDRHDAHERSRAEFAVRQRFGTRSHVVRIGVVERLYRDRRPRQRSVQASWGVALGRGMAQATLERFARAPGTSERQATLGVSIPLSSGGGPDASLRSHARAGESGVAFQSGIGGRFGRDRRHQYGASLAHIVARDRETTTTSATLGSEGRAGRIEVGYSASPSIVHATASATGSVLVHPHGVTTGPRLGETAALVRAPHARGAQLLQYAHVRLDRQGRALVPDLSPYRWNRIGVDPRDAPRDVRFDWTERDIVPRAGAIVDVALPTTRAPAHFLRIVGEDGTPMPFGASVVTVDGAEIGIVGRDGVARVAWVASTTGAGVDRRDAIPRVRWHDRGGSWHCRLPAIELSAIQLPLMHVEPDALREVRCVDHTADAEWSTDPEADARAP